MATQREYLVGLGLAKPGRGKFSKEAHAALAEAVANGVTFDEPAYKAPKVKEVATEGADAPSQPSRPISESAKIREWATSNGVKVGNRGRIPSDVINAFKQDDASSIAPAAKPVYKIEPQVRVRQVKCMYGEDDAGRVVGFGMCQRCTYHVSFCKCKAGPKPPSVVVKVLDRFDAL